MLSIAEMMAAFPREGRVEWIGVRPARHAEIDVVETVEAVVQRGLRGDRSAERSNHKRQVTLIQSEHLVVIARLLHREHVVADLLRRNIVVSGINLAALHNQTFRIGDALFEGTGYCHPCSRMEAALGGGGYNAMRGHGGITAKVLNGGLIRVRDAVTWKMGSDHVE